MNRPLGNVHAVLLVVYQSTWPMGAKTQFSDLNCLMLFDVIACVGCNEHFHQHERQNIKIEIFVCIVIHAFVLMIQTGIFHLNHQFVSRQYLKPYNEHTALMHIKFISWNIRFCQKLWEIVLCKWQIQPKLNLPGKKRSGEQLAHEQFYRKRE